MNRLDRDERTNPPVPGLQHFPRLVVLIEEQFGVEPETVRMEARLVEDLSCDSLDRFELAQAVESRFGLPDEITDAEIAAVATVADLAALIEAKIEGAEAPAAAPDPWERFGNEADRLHDEHIGDALLRYNRAGEA